MTKKIILKLKSINYSRNSIGDDIRMEVIILGEYFSIAKKIEVGTQQEFNKIIGEFYTDRKILEADINLRIIEDDPVFNDTGNLQTQIKIDTAKSGQEFVYEIKVEELRGWKNKVVAVFSVVLAAEILETETYISETSDGWLKVEIDGTGKKESLPAFLRVKLLRSDSKRDYFTILEGSHRGKNAFATRKLDNTSYLQSGILVREFLTATYSISKKSLTVNNQTYVADDDPNNLLKVGLYDIEIPDAPHKLGRLYLDRARFALVWFRIGHNGDRYLHTGSVSAGCLSMNEIKK